MIKAVAATAIVGSAVVACALPIDVTDDEAAIRAVDAQMVAALNALDIDRWIGFIADDARMMPPDSPPVEGKPAIREFISGLASLPAIWVTHFDLDSIVVSESGDLAYVSFHYELRIRVGALTAGSRTEFGKAISIFEKEADGSWKLAVGMWSPNESS